MTAIPQPALSTAFDSLESALAAVRSQLRLSRNQLLAENADRAPVAPALGSDGSTKLAATAERIYKGRRSRDLVFNGMSIFADPAWDIMLDLFIHMTKDRRISVSSAAVASCVAPTTALRWIALLERDGLVERDPDPEDRRRSHLRLSDRGYHLMADAIDRF